MWVTTGLDEKLGHCLAIGRQYGVLDIDSWLCNMNFDTQHFPYYLPSPSEQSPIIPRFGPKPTKWPLA